MRMEAQKKADEEQRKVEEQQRKKLDEQKNQKNQRVPEVHRKDPRRVPTVLASEAILKKKDGGASKNESPSPSATSSTTSLGSFKIPKKKKAEPEIKVKPDKSPVRADSRPGDHSVVDEKPSTDDDASDSEAELKIAEDHTASDTEEEVKEKRETGKSPEPVDDSNVDEKTNSKAKTLDFLQNLVASLEPEAAKKLLERANNLGNTDEKLSLKQLQFILAVDSDNEREDEGKNSEEGKKDSKKPKAKPGKTKASPKLKPQKGPPTPGTRRSRRLAMPEEKIEDAISPKVEALPTDEDDDDGQLVIDEGGSVSADHDELEETLDTPANQDLTNKNLQNKGKRGRPPKVKVIPEVKSQVPGEPTDNILNNSVDDTEDGIPRIVDIKRESKDSVSEDTKSKQKVPKSKTWFPGVRDTRSNVGSIGERRRRTIKDVNVDIQIKKEVKEADPAVFFTSEACDSFKELQLKANPEIGDGKVEKVKDRLEKVTSIFQKLSKLSNPSTDEDAKALKKETKNVGACDNKAPEEICASDPLGLDVIVTEEGTAYKDCISVVIDRLSNEVEQTETPNDENLETKDRVGFLDLIKNMRKHAEECPSSDDSSVIIIDRKDEDLLKLCQPPATGTGLMLLKDKVTVDTMMNPTSLIKMFKCMARPSCCFTTDDPEQFGSHLFTEHSTSKRRDRHGWLNCAYCFQKLSSPKHLIDHIIKVHGHNGFQCRYCFYRTSQMTDLFLHHQVSHSGQKKALLRCKSIPSEPSNLSAVKVSYKPYKCRLNDCGFQAPSSSELSKHLYMEHHRTGPSFSVDYQCMHCHRIFLSHAKLVLHCKCRHPNKPVMANVRKVDSILPEISDESLSDEEESIEEVRPEVEKAEEEMTKCRSDEDGFFGFDLFRCGNKECGFSADNVSDFKDHVSICEFSVDAMFLSCYHCERDFKHAASLVDHLKSHGIKRYACSLCSAYKSAVPMYVKNHMKAAHKVSTFKMVPIQPLKNNHDTDKFICLPKNSIGKGLGHVKTKDTFSPDQISKIPRVSMFRHLIRCSVCDFMTRVRQNMVKHLWLHQKSGKEVHEEKIIPFITPINPPTEEEITAASRMTSLLDDDSKLEKVKGTMSKKEMASMPPPVAENKRYRCCDAECSYVTIDEVMLIYHIKALHTDLDGYKCPHCPMDNPLVPFEHLDFHLKCHGDMLFKCAHCNYYHWRKRTAEEHVKEDHPNQKLFVRDVRREAEMLDKVASAPSSTKEVKPSIAKKDHTPYQPYKCGLCDHAEEAVEKIRKHCETHHELSKQFKCSQCDLTSNAKSEIDSHIASYHKENAGSVAMIRIFYADPSSAANDVICEERREPLWQRNMPGLKHIRGILYEDYDADTVGNGLGLNHGTSFNEPEAEYDTKGSKGGLGVSSQSSDVDEVDNFPMKCKECGLSKKTVKGLKMHIKLLHLRTGKFLCQKCPFSANMLNSINTHYKIKHPEIESPDFEERQDEAKTFSHEFWKADWNIPTLQERKAMVAGRKANKSLSDPFAFNDDELLQKTPKKGVKKTRKNQKEKVDIVWKVRKTAIVSV